MLFTPHLFSFKKETGLTFETEGGGTSEIFEIVADILYCAALNAWVLDGKGTFEEAPFTRGDFNEFMYANPKSFGKAASLALEALTGKSIKDFIKEGKNEPENAKNEPGESKKKLLLAWIGRRSKNSSAERAD